MPLKATKGINTWTVSTFPNKKGYVWRVVCAWGTDLIGFVILQQGGRILQTKGSWPWKLPDFLALDEAIVKHQMQHNPHRGKWQVRWEKQTNSIIYEVKRWRDSGPVFPEPEKLFTVKGKARSPYKRLIPEQFWKLTLQVTGGIPRQRVPKAKV